MLYERVRDDIGENGKLNYHLYAALKKALFKPQPWVKAILLPLARDNCTLREAVIIGSVVAKVGRLGRSLRSFGCPEHRCCCASVRASVGACRVVVGRSGVLTYSRDRRPKLERQRRESCLTLQRARVCVCVWVWDGYCRGVSVA